MFTLSSLIILTLFAQPKEYGYFKIIVESKQEIKLLLDNQRIFSNINYKVEMKQNELNLQIKAIFGNGNKTEQKVIDIVIYKGYMQEYRLKIDAEPTIMLCKSS